MRRLMLVLLVAAFAATSCSDDDEFDEDQTPVATAETSTVGEEEAQGSDQ